MKFKNKNVLVLSPHTDDAEIGVGGFIAKLKESNCSIDVIAFSKAYTENSIDIEKEYSASMDVLEINNYKLLNLQTRKLHLNRDKIRNILYNINKDKLYQVILIPSENDKHQDHEVICQEAIRIFKYSSILGYEISSNNLISKNTCFVQLKKTHIKKKLLALKNYRSQSNKKFMKKSRIMAQLKYYGMLSNNKYAERLDVIKLYL